MVCRGSKTKTDVLLPRIAEEDGEATGRRIRERRRDDDGGGWGYNRLPPITLFLHRIRNLNKPSNIRTSNQARQHLSLSRLRASPLGSSIVANSVTFRHDTVKLRVDFLSRPGETLRVLRHFETGDGDTAAVGCLC